MTRNASPDDPSTDSETEQFTASGPAAPLAAALEAVDAVVDECVLAVDAGGLSVAATGPAEVAMVALSLPASAFEAYEAEAARLGVDLERLRSVVGVADRDEPVRLALDPASRTLHLGVGELAYTLGLIDPDAIRSPPPETDFGDQFAAAVTLPGAALARCVDAAAMVADHLELGVDPDGPTFYAGAEGDTDAVEVEFAADEVAAVDPGDARSLFSVGYLEAFARVIPDDADVDLRLGREAPLELAFELEGASVRYVLAPRRRAG